MEADSNATNAPNTINPTGTDEVASCSVNTDVNAVGNENATTATANTESTSTVTNTLKDNSSGGSNIADNANNGNSSSIQQTTGSRLAVTFDSFAKAKSKMLHDNKDNTTGHDSDGHSNISNVSNINNVIVIDDDNNSNHNSDNNNSTRTSAPAAPNVPELNLVNGDANVNNSVDDTLESVEVPDDSRMNVDYEPDQTVVGDLQDGDADGNVLTEDEPTDDNETEPEADNAKTST
ncbi:unnamed protein product [Ambrosiozyma monospora]|uniref:Unnamed protein product n=1 Tax=Ambrosiozyma monospora TaxID=43982 RepID=A0ACB5U9J2_AMBMO|nr:unnamed protein product [Ambrosiozyma monospora]